MKYGYGKILREMNTINSKTLPAPPNVINIIMAGFDSITNHLSLILFPIILDLFLWFGPQLSLKNLIKSMLESMAKLSVGNPPEIMKIMELNQQIWEVTGNHFNLFSIIRTYPVGIPSLMVSIQPVTNPFNTPYSIQILSVSAMVVIWILLTLFGLSMGAFYFGSVAQVAINGEIQWSKAIIKWPWMAAQVWLLTLLWLAIVLALSVPVSCVLTLLSVGGGSFGRIGALVFIGMVLWLIFPLIFSSHGIFVYHRNMWESVKQGIKITRYTFPTTALFVFIILVLSEGLDMLWRIPGESSWLTMIGLAGHGFVASGVLASTFIYFRDATSWVDQVLQRIKLSSIT